MLLHHYIQLPLDNIQSLLNHHDNQCYVHKSNLDYTLLHYNLNQQLFDNTQLLYQYQHLLRYLLHMLKQHGIILEHNSSLLLVNTNQKLFDDLLLLLDHEYINILNYTSLLDNLLYLQDDNNKLLYLNQLQHLFQFHNNMLNYIDQVHNSSLLLVNTNQPLFLNSF